MLPPRRHKLVTTFCHTGCYHANALLLVWDKRFPNITKSGIVLVVYTRFDRSNHVKEIVENHKVLLGRMPNAEGAQEASTTACRVV